MMAEGKVNLKNRLSPLFQEEKQEGAYSREDYIDKPNATFLCRLGDRTLEYFIKVRIIKPGIKPPGASNRKAKYWRRDYLLAEIKAIKDLQDGYGQTISEIREVAKATKYNLNDVIIILDGSVEDAIRRLRKCFNYPDDIKREIATIFLALVRRGEIKSNKDRILFQEALDVFIKTYTDLIKPDEHGERAESFKLLGLRSLGDELLRVFGTVRK